MPQQLECQLYLDRPEQTLLQARDNLNLEYYDVTTSPGPTAPCSMRPAPY